MNGKMSNTFEKELQKLFGDGKIIENPTYSGRTCFGTLGKDLRVRAQFVSTRVSSEYDALKLTILNRTDGPVDSLTLKMEDLLGMKPVPNNPNFRDGVIPRLWEAYGEVKWYAYRPNTKDYKIIQEAAERYLSVFRGRQQEREQSGPRLVYICAPLDENVSENIEFARIKAQEVLQFGDIPICPHLMFPPIIGLEHPELEQKMRKMGLRMIETCQQVNVYGTVLSKGMQTEINRAVLLNIPVKSDANVVSYKLQKSKKKKGKNAYER